MVYLLKQSYFEKNSWHQLTKEIINQPTDWLTDSMEHSNYWEAGSRFPLLFTV
jgi:hypothetical protein